MAWRGVRGVVLLAAALLVLPGSRAVTAEQRAWMEGVAKLPDAVFLRRDDGALRGLPERVLDSGYTGLWLAGPRAVPVEQLASASALLISAQTEERQERIALQRNGLVVATDVDTGEVRVGDAFPGQDEKSPPDAPTGKEPARPPPPRQPVPADPALAALTGAGNSAGTTWLDLPALLPLPAKPGRWAVRVISYDQLSNPVYLQIGAPSFAEPSLSVDEARTVVDHLRARMKTPPALPSYMRVPDTPALSGNGVALQLGRAEAARGSGPIAAHAALRIPVTGPRLVRVPAQVVGAAPPKVIVRAMLLVVLKDRDVPVRIPVEVPLWTGDPVASGQVVEAAFSVDLAAHLPPAIAAGTVQVYLLAGPYAAGPHALDLR